MRILQSTHDAVAVSLLPNIVTGLVTVRNLGITVCGSGMWLMLLWLSVMCNFGGAMRTQHSVL